MNTKKVITIFIVLAVLIVGGSLAYSKLGKRQTSLNQVAPTAPVKQGSPSAAASNPPSTIQQDVKNPALEGLAAKDSTNTLTINVFVDANNNAKKDSGEENFKGSVEVAYGIPGKTSNAFTDNNGKVTFENVASGTYTVYMFNTPKGYVLTTAGKVADVKIPPSANIDFGIKESK